MSLIEAKNLSIKFLPYHDRAPSLKAYFAGLHKRGGSQTVTDFWAVRDVNFTIKAGDRVGIVGHNGAGKSTLLKALCRVYEPPSGTLRVQGKIAPTRQDQYMILTREAFEKEKPKLLHLLRR